jgi:chromosome segregation ATPase
MGIWITASEASRLFRAEELAQVVEDAIDHNSERRRLEDAVTATLAARTRALRLYNDVVAELVIAQRALGRAVSAVTARAAEVAALAHWQHDLSELLDVKEWLDEEIAALQHVIAYHQLTQTQRDSYVQMCADFLRQLARVEHDIVHARDGVRLLEYAQRLLDTAVRLVEECEEQVNDMSSDVAIALRRFDEADYSWDLAVNALEAWLRANT